jgi:2-polyprenyl-6-methoxyphenol hydroxylase-like FAD-dependent oxidoreductase
MGASRIGDVAYLKGGVPKPIDKDNGLQLAHVICCIYNPFDKNRVAWALSTIGPARKTKTNLNAGYFEGLKKEALEMGHVFKEPLKSVVEATVRDTEFVRPANSKEAFQHDECLDGVMFIGDASHIISPYELVGADMALKDGWDLAEHICRPFFHQGCGSFL